VPPFLLPLFLLLPAIHGKRAKMDFSKADGKDFFDAKCSACVSIVMELERNLELEQPRMNVDLRNTLMASNDQNNKIIPYEVSELRIIETIEELCPAMNQYGITKMEDGFVSFQRYNAKGAGTVKIQGSMVREFECLANFKFAC